MLLEVLISPVENIQLEPKFWILFSEQFSRQNQNLQEENAGNLMKHKIVSDPKNSFPFLKWKQPKETLQGDRFFMYFTKQGKQLNNGFVSGRIQSQKVFFGCILSSLASFFRRKKCIFFFHKRPTMNWNFAPELVVFKLVNPVNVISGSPKVRIMGGGWLGGFGAHK